MDGRTRDILRRAGYGASGEMMEKEKWYRCRTMIPTVGGVAGRTWAMPESLEVALHKEQPGAPGLVRIRIRPPKYVAEIIGKDVEIVEVIPRSKLETEPCFIKDESTTLEIWAKLLRAMK